MIYDQKVSFFYLLVSFFSNGFIHKPMLNKFLVNCGILTCNRPLITDVFAFFSHRIKNTNLNFNYKGIKLKVRNINNEHKYT